MRTTTGQRCQRATASLLVALSLLVGACDDDDDDELTTGHYFYDSQDNLFGMGVALSGSTLAISASHSFFPNHVYLYVWDGAQWTLTDQITAPPGVETLRFGEDLLFIGDDTLVVFASNELAWQSNVPDKLFFYAHDDSGWRQTGEFELDEQLSSCDRVVRLGERIVFSSETRALSTFERDGQGWRESQQVLSQPGEAPFTSHCGVVGAGDTIAVAASTPDHASAIHLYREGEPQWHVEATLRGADVPGGATALGMTLAMSEDTVVASGFAGDLLGNLVVEVFERSEAGGWHHAQRLTAPVSPGESQPSVHFGQHLVVADDVLAIAGPAASADRSGVTLFRRADARWSAVDTVVSEQSRDWFGQGLALDGAHLVVSASHADGRGAVYVYRLEDASLEPVQRLVAPNDEAMAWLLPLGR